MITRDKSKELLDLLLYAIAIIVVILPRSLFNLNMEDEGWLLTAYYNIFTAPSSVSYNFLYYNGILIGGICDLLFGQYGLIAFRIAHAIIDVFKGFLVYLILRKYCNRYAIMIGFIVLESVQIFFPVLSHNQISSLFCLISIFFIAKSLETKEWWHMLMGGIFVGINVFTRIPNISLCALIFVLLLFWLDSRDNKSTLNLLLAAIGGFIVGCVIEGVLMLSLGHFDIFIDNVASGFSASGDADSTHNLASLGKFYYQQLRVIGYRVAALVTMGVIFMYVKRVIRPKNRIAYIGTIIVLSLVTIFIAYTRDLLSVDPELIRFQHRLTFDERINAISAIMCIYIVITSTNGLRYAVLLALLFQFLLPLGSDWGYNANITYQAMCLSFSLVVAYIYDMIKHKRILREIYILPVCIFLVSVIGFRLSITGREYINNCKYIVSGKKGYEMHSPLATTIITDEIFTKLNPVLDELAKYVKPNDVILCYQSPAMIHYLTQTKPYLENAWPWTYTSADMEFHFIKAQKESEKLPVVVREKGSVFDIFNEMDYPDWDNSEAEENRFHKNKKIRLIQDFIRDNGYKVVWEDNAFQILLPYHESI